MRLAAFLDGLQGLTFEGVTMLARAPVSPPDEALLPVCWVDLPMIIGRPATTMLNSGIRPYQYRVLLLLALAYARQNEQEDHRGRLVEMAETVAGTLDVADIGFRLSYEVAVDKKIAVGGQAFYGVATVITGER